jgi:hypothetical protein
MKVSGKYQIPGVSVCGVIAFPQDVARPKGFEPPTF